MNALYAQLNKAKMMDDQTMVRLLLDQITYIQTASSLEEDEMSFADPAPRVKRKKLIEEFGKN